MLSHYEKCDTNDQCFNSRELPNTEATGVAIQDEIHC